MKDAKEQPEEFTYRVGSAVTGPIESFFGNLKHEPEEQKENKRWIYKWRWDLTPTKVSKD